MTRNFFRINVQLNKETSNGRMRIRVLLKNT